MPSAAPQLKPIDNLASPSATPSFASPRRVSAPVRERDLSRSRDGHERDLRLRERETARVAEPERRVSARDRREVEFASHPAASTAAQRRAQKKQRHRPLRLTWTATLCGCALMGQLVVLLWLHGRALTAAREVEKVDAQIAEVFNQIERTQERIAAFDSSPQIKQWARQAGWREANQLDMDDITKVDASRVGMSAAARQTPTTDAPASASPSISSPSEDVSPEAQTP
jgi:hypothetical protein